MTFVIEKNVIDEVFYIKMLSSMFAIEIPVIDRGFHRKTLLSINVYV